MKFSIKSLPNFISCSKKTILLIIIVSGLTLLISTSVSTWLSSYHNTNFPSFGTIRVIGVEAYGGDIRISPDGQQYLDWGTTYADTVVNRSFHIKSKSNMPVTLTLSASNFMFKNSLGANVTKAPPISEPLKITWNYNNTLINPNESIYVTLSLKVSSDTTFLIYLIDNGVQGFAFEIAIKASPTT